MDVDPFQGGLAASVQSHPARPRQPLAPQGSLSCRLGVAHTQCPMGMLFDYQTPVNCGLEHGEFYVT